jgi:hypothetical protein
MLIRKTYFNLPRDPLVTYLIIAQGTLKGFDQTINIILEQSHERVYSEDRGVIQNTLGLYIIRGDNMYVKANPFFLSFIS